MPSKVAKKNKGGEVAAVKAKAPKVVQPEAESESSEESSDEAPEPVKAPVKGKKQPVKKQAASEGDSEESDEDEEDSEDEEPAPLGKTAGEAESEESESEEEPKPAKKGKVQKASEPAKPAESDEESEGSDEDAEPVVFIVGANKLGGPALKKFFKKKGITVKAVTILDKKTIAVDLMQASDVPKALALSGQDLNGQVLTIQSEASPKKEAGKKDAKKAVKRPASDDEEEEDEEEEEEDDDDEDMEEEDAQAKRKKDKQSGNAAKKQKLNQSAAEEVFTAFIGGLKAESTEDTVKKFLKKKGIEVKVVRKMEGKRFGYVDVCTKEELQEVVALSGQTIDGEAIRVEEAKPKGSTPEKAGRQQRDTSADERTLFVKNIPNSVDEDQLKEFFSEASEVRMPQKDGSHKGFAYVVFPDMETADSVLSEKQGADLEGNALYLDRTGSKSSFSRGDDRRKSTGLRGESTVLFVKNLSYNVDEDTLKEAFPDAVSARIARFADSGKHRGFGFVDFSSPAAASKAYDEKQNTEIDGREVVLDFSSPQGQGGGRGGFRGGRGGFGDRGRGGRGGRGGFRGGRGGYGDRGGRGGRGGFRGGRGGGRMGEPQGKKKRFNDSDSD